MNDMNKFMRIMKKQEKAERKDSVNELEIKDLVKIKKDSLFQVHDTAWWKQKRPVPLTSEEVSAKTKIYSVFIAKKLNSENPKKDTLKKQRPFAWYKYPGKLVLGGSLWEDSLWIINTKGMLNN